MNDEMEKVTNGRNSEIEEKIINSFFVKRKRERAKFALGSPKKRSGFIWSFDESIFLNEYLTKIEQPIPSHEELYDILKCYNAPENCYVIAAIDMDDGKEKRLIDALEHNFGRGPALISCIVGELAYLECEQEVGAPDRYILKRE